MKDGKYTKPVKLSNAINDEGCFRPYIAPDESYIIFDRRKSDNNIGNKNKEDLYISFRDRNSEWTKAQNMGISINTEYRDKRPFVSFDGIDGLYFSDNYLYAIQNELLTQVSRFSLNKDATHLERCEIFEKNTDDLRAPTTGVIVDNYFYFIADTQGKGSKLKGVVVMKAPLK